MSKPKILVQLDTDVQPSVFDGVVAIDAGVEHLFRHGGVQVSQVRDLVFGAMFTRGVDDLRSTAIFVGGSDVSAGEAVLHRCRRARSSARCGSRSCSIPTGQQHGRRRRVDGARHVRLADADVTVLAATGPVGSRIVRLLALEGGGVRVASRTKARAEATCQAAASRVPGASLTPLETTSPAQTAAALDGAQVVIAAGDRSRAPSRPPRAPRRVVWPWPST